MKNIDLRSQNPESREELRRVAIRRLRAGKNKSEISRELGIRRSTISNWLVTYEKTGSISQPEKKRGRPTGEGRRLSQAQELRIQKDIIERLPDQLKLPFALWSADAVRQLIKQYFLLDMPIRTVRSYLSRWGFTPQRPVKRAYEQQPKQVMEWLNQSYPFIKQRAKEEGAEIHWGYETSLSNLEHYPQGYAPKEHPPVLTLSQSTRERVNMVSSINNQGKVRFMIYDGKFTAQVFIRFMTQLIKGSKTKIFLILDNLHVLHAKIVKQWLEDWREQIELFFYPATRPSLVLMTI